jgi:hypothetical protein
VKGTLIRKKRLVENRSGVLLPPPKIPSGNLIELDAIKKIEVIIPISIIEALMKSFAYIDRIGETREKEPTAKNWIRQIIANGENNFLNNFSITYLPVVKKSFC